MSLSTANPSRRRAHAARLNRARETPVQGAHGAIDGEAISLRASERVEIRCGEASIVLTKEGKVIVNGTYVSVGSDGVLRLDGGSVNMN